MNIPNDPIMLLSFINTRLRDQYQDLDSLCDDLDLDKTELTQKLQDAGYRYNVGSNQFQ